MLYVKLTVCIKGVAMDKSVIKCGVIITLSQDAAQKQYSGSGFVCNTTANNSVVITTGSWCAELLESYNKTTGKHLPDPHC